MGDLVAVQVQRSRVLYSPDRSLSNRRISPLKEHRLFRDITAFGLADSSELALMQLTR